MSRKRIGQTIIPHGVIPEEHELQSASVFTGLGKDVEFIAPRRTKDSTTPDIMIDGIQWEIKSPTGKSKTTVSNALRRAVKQSPNVIFDARRTTITDIEVEKEIKRNLKLTQSLKRILLITKSSKIIEITR